MSETKNLWPTEILSESSVQLPIRILNEQASYLNEMTKNLLVAVVDTTKIVIQVDPNQTKPGILHTFKIKAPALGNYDFELFRLVQEEILPYPLKIYSPLIEQKFDIKNSGDLEITLKAIFSHKKTVNIVQTLILQSRNG